jgi:hypothetical protein
METVSRCSLLKIPAKQGIIAEGGAKIETGLVER